MSLLLLLAAFGSRVRHRIYLCHGLRFEGATGRRRYLLQLTERLLVALSTATIAVSPSVRARLADVGASSRKLTVLGSGSANGIDIQRFERTPERIDRSRARRGLREGDQAVAFVGRLTHDKGLSALLVCACTMPNVTFLVAGNHEPRNAADRRAIQQLSRLDNVCLLGRVSEIEEIYWASDALLLPTVREGMPTVVLEAAAAGRPTVAFEATGTVDAIVDGTTGLLVSSGDDRAFAVAAARLLSDTDLCQSMGNRAENRVRQLFEGSAVWENWSRYFKQLT